MRVQSREIILRAYDEYHHPKYLELDPLGVLRPLAREPGIEGLVLIGALFSFGNVKQIRRAIQNLCDRLMIGSSQSLMRRLDQITHKDLKILDGFSHRIYCAEDVKVLILLYQSIVLEHICLENWISKILSKKTQNQNQVKIEYVLNQIMNELTERTILIQKRTGITVGKSFHHLLNAPSNGGACKRWLMYLKWMVRDNDGIDLGLWKNSGLSPQDLLIPLDVHLFRVSKSLGLCKGSQPNFKKAIEVTSALRAIDSKDPTRFDFSLCRLGMLQKTRV